MKTIKVVPIIRYWFECTDCGEGTELLGKPDPEDTVFCEGCGQEFVPVVENVCKEVFI